MASGNKVIDSEFRLIKSKLRWHNPYHVAGEVGRSVAIVLKVKACRDFDEYEKLVRAEHPPVKNSLADRVSDLEVRVDFLERSKTYSAYELNRNDCD